LRRYDILRLVRKHSVFLVCRPLYIEIHNPPAIGDEDLVQIFGRLPPLRNPPAIPTTAFNALLAETGVQID
jgi:hypothetical protein